MPHADSSYFFGSTKAEIYPQLLDQTRGLLSGQRNWVSVFHRFARGVVFPGQYQARKLTATSNLSNVSSLLWHTFAALPSPSSSVNWAGFYIRDDKFPALASPVSSPPLGGGPNIGSVTISTTYASTEDQLLLLGPFMGKPACQEIRFGKGVCGTAAATQKTVVVPDVEQFPGHIACDAESRSEIVVPILVRGETVAIIDIDCAQPDGFDDVDKKYLEELAEILAESCDW
ncbi:Free methionine-R-sulfoxide reductase [Penicillium cosmopolitanum]|uniref:Free methionine-R-sulfoxide reductase n=1 Tax=Penicillium cosmopolitanum TaxID=1131564 RepID=A0A9X0B387_9EURO|nr:Free methionine-R-sulfoxide reductase [Penicillium cosmopolitanum]KAJ5386482.1 Free methionine-R-sulfoxide reductase [Penicillium cosmopolitanum]